MGIVIVGVFGIFLVIIIALYAILKVLHGEKLFFMSALSFTFFTAIFTGAGYFFMDDLTFTFTVEGEVEEAKNEVFPDETPFAVERDGSFSFFSTFKDAVIEAKTIDAETVVYFRDLNTVAWENTTEIPQEVLNVPLILQLPDLPRGAAVTSLAMLLNFAGEKVDKTELATNLKKDMTPLSKDANGNIHWGNPYEGFVGEMFFFDSPGYGVYHPPIMELAADHLPNQMINLSGAEFQDVLYPIHQGSPVWVIIHTQFKTLDENQFQTWQTPTGEVEVTYYQHSVLITGYDDQVIYYNDPLSLEVNRPMQLERFQQAWEQMGKQAISYLQ